MRPDGLVRRGYGKGSYTALIEVKTGENLLKTDQINAYWEVARQYGFDAVVTISNEIGHPGMHPTGGLKVRANSKVKVQHYSWTEILSTAVMCKVHRGIGDPEQAWILGELIRYLEHPASGAMTFADMGPNWVGVRDGARALHPGEERRRGARHRPAVGPGHADSPRSPLARRSAPTCSRCCHEPSRTPAAG